MFLLHHFNGLLAIRIVILLLNRVKDNCVYFLSAIVNELKINY